MAFVPYMKRQPTLMNPAIFNEPPMGLRARLPLLPLADRFTYDAASRTMFSNFERLLIRTPADVEAVCGEVEQRLAPLGHKVYGVVTTTISCSTHRSRTPWPKWCGNWSSGTI